MVHRRRLLLLSAGACGILSGCTFSSQDRVSIDSIRVSNADNQPHDVKLVLIDKETVVFSNQSRVSSKDGRVLGTYVLSSGWGENGEYMLAIKVDNQDWKQQHIQPKSDSNCVDLSVRINESGNVVVMSSVSDGC